jgi:metal-responsive CopG/Arc/MetJ family transcriptional regulator
MSRSELFTKAVQRYLDQLDQESLTTRIDAAIDLVRQDESVTVAVEHGARHLAGVEDDW